MIRSNDFDKHMRPKSNLIKKEKRGEADTKCVTRNGFMSVIYFQLSLPLSASNTLFLMINLLNE